MNYSLLLSDFDKPVFREIPLIPDCWAPTCRFCFAARWISPNLGSGIDFKEHFLVVRGCRQMIHTCGLLGHSMLIACRWSRWRTFCGQLDFLFSHLTHSII